MMVSLVIEHGDVPHQRVHVDHLGPGVGPRQHLAHALDDVAGATVVVDDVGDNRAQFGQRRLLVLEKARGRLCVAQDSGERLVQLVGERRGELAHADHASDMRQLVPGALDFELGFLARRGVGQHLCQQANLDDRDVSPGARQAVADGEGAVHGAANDEGNDGTGLDMLVDVGLAIDAGLCRERVERWKDDEVAAAD